MHDAFFFAGAYQDDKDKEWKKSDALFLTFG